MDRTSEKCTILASTIKMLGLLCSFALFSCLEGKETANASLVSGDSNPVWLRVDSFFVALSNSEKGCILLHKKGSEQPDSILIGIAAPCDFVRKPGNLSEPLSYVYGLDRIVMITGGPVDTFRKDAFQPNGCGTEVRALVVGSEGIRVSERIELGADHTVCPSDGLDEVFYATVPIN